MTDQSQSTALSGRELSRARRRAMSHTGARNIKAGASSAVAQQAPTAEMSTNGLKGLSGKALSMARRAMLAQGGKATVAASSVASATSVSRPQPVAAPIQEAEQSEACCDACADANSSEPCAGTVAKDAASSEALDNLCDIIESTSEGSSNASSSVKAFCRERRNTLSKKGKLGLPGKAGRQARKSLVRSAATSSLTGKALAKLRREEHCQFGRGDSAACRPSGRVRSGSGDAPPKVEVGTTLSGQAVTGTQVEQTEKITGSESGVCRTVTGTEYLGAEQFAKFCSATPPPPAAKVGLSETGRGQLLTGSKTAGNDKVTGDETGHCKSVTGSEYLGAEHFGAFCGSQGVNKTEGKVVSGRSEKNMRITGVDEARDNAVTGSESGANAAVTGSDYSNAAPRSAAVESPAKVGLSHTASGVSVSGGELSRTEGITGDHQDSCQRVTGVEYVSTERFQSVCGSVPESAVAKVGVDTSRGGMSITGNLVDRSEHVTGNEPGSCKRVTGSQYGEAARSGLCEQRSSKVQQMHTSQGKTLTGTEASSSPKLTGDDRGGCAIVTGSEYISQEHFKQSCSQAPAPSGRRADMSQTWHNQHISGVQTGHSQKVTGDEHGICNTVTGSAYAGRDQASEFCGTPAVAQGEQRLAAHATSVMPVSGIGPGADERFAGNSQRGVCQELTGTPYQGLQDRAGCSAGAMHHLAQAPADQALPQSAASTVDAYKADFSVLSPAKAAWQQRLNDPVHSSVYARRESITGVVNKAEGVISGTPEFRHQRELEPVASVAVAQPETTRLERITGEGSEAGTQITGDDWSRGGMVTGTEGLFSAKRNQTQQGTSVERNNIGAHALKDRARPEAKLSRVTGSSGGTSSESAAVTLSGGASG